jgi:hypothetical protein
MSEISLGKFGYWTLCCRRATHGFCRSLTQLFETDATTASTDKTFRDAAVLKTSI